MIHDHFTKVCFLRWFVCAFSLLLRRGVDCCGTRLRLRILKSLLEGTIQAFLVLTDKLTEELIVIHVLGMHPHFIPIVILHDVLSDHGCRSVIQAQFEINSIDRLGNLIRWQAARNRCLRGV